MVGKPFSIQAPEEIAKEYGGNKQKIAQAAQLGVVDPTAALLAGMFIDRMRSAQVQEMTPQQSVAQQVMGGVGSAPAAGPPVAGGLGALPPEAPPMAPPPMAPPGMAEGGYYAGGGLGDLPVPDTMFDEPENGGYGGGGIVAFATGTPGIQEPAQEDLASMFAPAYQQGLDFYAQQLPAPKYEGLNLLTSEARQTLADQAKQRKEDKWMALAQLGFGMAASNSPYFLQALGASAAAALPGMAAAKKEREARKRQAISDLAEAENITRRDAMERVRFGQEYASTQLGLKKDDLARGLEQWKTLTSERGATERANISAGATLGAARINAKSYQDYADKQEEQLRRQARLKAPEMALEAIKQDPGLAASLRGNPTARARVIREKTAFYYQQLTGEPLPGADAGGGKRVQGGKIISAVPVPQ